MNGKYVKIEDLRNKSSSENTIFMTTQNALHSGSVHNDDFVYQFHDLVTVEEAGQLLGGN